MQLGLRVALKHDGKIYSGDRADSHITAAERLGIPAPEENRGFSPDGKLWLNRQKALGWVKYNEPKVFRKVITLIGKDGMHSEHYAEAKGIKQRELPPKTELTPGIGKPRASEQVDAKHTFDKVDLSDKTAIVYDRGGLYLYCAEKLAEKYKKVYYFLPDSDAYPTSQKCVIGTGLKNIKRIHNLWEYIDKVDIIYDFDCYDGYFMNWLRDKGYVVFSSGLSAEVEVDKIYFLELLEELKLPVAETYLAEGLDDLEKYLEKHSGKTLFLKNLHRGDFESRKFTSMAQIRPFIDDLRKRLGSASNTIQVLVQHKIESECESGVDTFCIDGEYPDKCVIAYEDKDKCAVAKVANSTPDILKGINDAFSKTFKKRGYRGNYSTEVRITKDGAPYFIDPTCRVPSPPGELLCEIFENWAESTWQIANGIIPELKEKAKYGVVVILTSAWYEDHELHVEYPAKYRQNIKLKNHTVQNGATYVIPNGNGVFFGAIATWADKLQDAIDEATKIAELMEVDEFNFDKHTFDAAIKASKTGEKFGIKF